jgi:hypothetical protein
MRGHGRPDFSGGKPAAAGSVEVDKGVADEESSFNLKDYIFPVFENSENCPGF